MRTRKRWEGKVRPVLGNSPHDRPVRRVISLSLRRVCDDPFSTAPWPSMPARMACVFQAWRNLSGPMWSKQNQTPGRDRAASRWSAPSQGSRTRREDRAPTHRPQMSSGRLFLDQVGRHQSPSPLHRQPELNTHFSGGQAKGDISTLPARGHFYFALTKNAKSLDNQISPVIAFRHLLGGYLDEVSICICSCRLAGATSTGPVGHRNY